MTQGSTTGGVATGDSERYCRLELLPNCSLTPRTALVFFTSLCAVSFGIAGFFVARGFWPVLPFAGLEMGLLGWALWASLQRGQRVQTITVTEQVIEVVTRTARGPTTERFPRHWARARLAPAAGWQPSRLTLECQGRACEVAALLTEEERVALYQRLAQLIGRTSESPPLAADRPA